MAIERCPRYVQAFRFWIPRATEFFNSLLNSRSISIQIEMIVILRFYVAEIVIANFITSYRLILVN